MTSKDRCEFCNGKPKGRKGLGKNPVPVRMKGITKVHGLETDVFAKLETDQGL